MTERKLADYMLLEERWLAATTNLARGLEVTEQQGLAMADAVVSGELEVTDLRAGVVFANALDKEAVEAAGGDISSLTGEDYWEAWARRFAHHAGITALNLVRSSDKRYLHWEDYCRRQGLTEQNHVLRGVGMGWPETKDYQRLPF